MPNGIIRRYICTFNTPDSSFSGHLKHKARLVGHFGQTGTVSNMVW